MEPTCTSRSPHRRHAYQRKSQQPTPSCGSCGVWSTPHLLSPLFSLGVVVAHTFTYGVSCCKLLGGEVANVDEGLRH